MRGVTKVVGADLQGLLLAHEKPDLAVLVALQQARLARTPLLPLPAVAVKPVQLALPAARQTASLFSHCLILAMLYGKLTFQYTPNDFAAPPGNAQASNVGRAQVYESLLPLLPRYSLDLLQLHQRPELC